MHTYFITLNWNTLPLMQKMIKSIDDTVLPTPSTWIVLDNGSTDQTGVYDWMQEYFSENVLVFDADKESWLETVKQQYQGPFYEAVLLLSNENLGCVNGHNLCFDMAEFLASGKPYQIVMVDTDVEVYEFDWLKKVMHFIDETPNVGIVGLEHSRAEVCAPAVFLDKHGNWYLHQEQAQEKQPVKGESVGLGMALLTYPVTKLRFDTGYKIYYKQDDDLCFSTRFDLGLDTWVYPIDMVHYGAGSLRENNYDVQDAHGWDAFDLVKQANQRYFAKKWAAKLDARRPNMQAELKRLEEMNDERETHCDV